MHRTICEISARSAKRNHVMSMRRWYDNGKRLPRENSAGNPYQRPPYGPNFFQAPPPVKPEVFLTQQKQVEFPPQSRLLLNVYAFFVLSAAAFDIYDFFRIRPLADEAVRQAKSGIVLGAERAAFAMLRLNFLATQGTTALISSSSSFPNWFPRIFSAGGLEAMRIGLDASDSRLTESAALLAQSTSLRPKAGQVLIKDDALRVALINCFSREVDQKICEDCGGSSSAALLPLLDTIANTLRHYPFGKNAAADETLTVALGKLAQRTVQFAMKNDSLTRPESIFPGSRSHPRIHPDITQEFFHDHSWQDQVTRKLLVVAIEAAFHCKKNKQEALHVVVEPILESLNRLYTLRLFDEEEETIFGLICCEVSPHSKSIDPSLKETSESFLKSFIFRNQPLRKSLLLILDYFEEILTLSTAFAFGYIWGRFRTNRALRDVQPPSYSPHSGAAPPVPVFGPVQPRMQSFATDPKRWRTEMSHKYGLRAGFGAFVFLQWMLLLSSNVNDYVVQRDVPQVGLELTYAFGSVGLCAYLLRNNPYFFFPALMTQALYEIEVNDSNAIEISLGTWPSRRYKVNNKPQDGQDESRWT